MTYAQFHDGFYKNRKVVKAGPEAAWLWAASIGYCNEELTDGFVPEEHLGMLLPNIDARPRAKLVDKLLAVGLWERAEGGWMVHDFLKWNFSKATVLKRREANLARVNRCRGKASNGDGNASVMRYNEGDTDSDQQGESQPSSVPLNQIQKPPPTPPRAKATGTDGVTTPAASAPSPNPEVAVDEPKTTEPRTPEAKPAEPEAPAAQPERPLADVVTLLSPADRNAGEALAQAMATASGGMFDPLSGSTAKRAELYRRLKHYRVTPAEAVVMGECCAEPGKTWKWATTISNGFGLGFLLGSETAEGFSGDALSQLVQIARKRIAAVQRAALAKAEAAALPPPAPRKPPATPEELAAIRPSFARALAPVAPPATPTEVTHG